MRIYACRTAFLLPSYNKAARVFMMTEKIGFGGGCHWCTEAVFNALSGIRDVQQGFIKSSAPNNYFSEAVIVEFEPSEIPVETLIEIHLRTHSSTSDHKMRKKYRSAIYTFSDDQAETAIQTLRQLQSQFDKPLVTQVLPFEEFKSSDDKFQNYFEKNAGGQFCKTYIDPKLSLIRQKYSSVTKVK